MCLGVPGQIIEITDSRKLTRSGKVRFGGIVKEINLSLVEQTQVEDYVIVHAGFAISKINQEEAMRVFSYLKEIGEIEELK